MVFRLWQLQALTTAAAPDTGSPAGRRAASSPNHKDGPTGEIVPGPLHMTMTMTLPLFLIPLPALVVGALLATGSL
jgi:hypothetical protein